jgi:hypothetical protein
VGHLKQNDAPQAASIGNLQAYTMGMTVFIGLQTRPLLQSNVAEWIPAVEIVSP